MTDIDETTLDDRHKWLLAEMRRLRQVAARHIAVMNNDGDYYCYECRAEGDDKQEISHASYCEINPAAPVADAIAALEQQIARPALLDVRAILADVQDGTPWQVAIDSALLRISAALEGEPLAAIGRALKLIGGA